MWRSMLLVWSCIWATSGALADEPAPTAAPATPWPELPTANFVDERVLARLRERAIFPSPLSDDGTFLRRLMLTAVGQLPTSAEVRTFTADSQPGKRARKIDELLAPQIARRPVGDALLGDHRQLARIARGSCRGYAETGQNVARLAVPAIRAEYAVRSNRTRHPDRNESRRRGNRKLDRPGSGALCFRRGTVSIRATQTERPSTCSGGATISKTNIRSSNWPSAWHRPSWGCGSIGAATIIRSSGGLSRIIDSLSASFLGCGSTCLPNCRESHRSDRVRRRQVDEGTASGPPLPRCAKSM